MGKVLANYLLMNLLERATTATDKTFLTTREIEALATLLDAGSDPEIVGNYELGKHVSRGMSGINVEELNSDVMHGVDFRTSFY